MKQTGSKQNSFLNNLWVQHAKKYGKKLAARIRRIKGKEEIKKELNEA